MSQLAAGFKTIADNGRERKTDGLWTHLGMMVTGGAGPAGPPSDGRVGLITLGQGQFQSNPPALSNLTYSQGQIQMLSQVGSPVSLGFHEAGSSALALYKPVGSNGPLRIRQSDGTDYPLAGAPGSVTSAMIAANAAQQLMGSYVGTPTFSTTTTAVWVATPMTVQYTSTGVPTRIELNTIFAQSIAQGSFYVGIAFDGPNPSIYWFYYTQGPAGYGTALSATYYITPGAGLHNVYVVAYNNSGGSTLTQVSVGYHTLYVTEMKR